MPVAHPSCVQEVAEAWSGYSLAQQQEMFDVVLVAAGQGAWGELEDRLRCVLAAPPGLAG